MTDRSQYIANVLFLVAALLVFNIITWKFYSIYVDGQAVSMGKAQQLASSIISGEKSYDKQHMANILLVAADRTPELYGFRKLSQFGSAGTTFGLILFLYGYHLGRRSARTGRRT